MNLIGAPGIETTTYGFRRRLVEVARELGVSPDDLATVISFESGGTFRADKKSGTSNCFGLIQFCYPAAEAARFGRNYSDAEARRWLSSMTAEQQLDVVLRYLQSWLKGRKGVTRDQLYLTVFAPAYRFASPETVVYGPGTAEYQSNSGMDLDRSGAITAGEVASKINSWYALSLKNPRVSVDDPSVIATAGVGGSVGGPGLVMLGIGGLLGWYVISTYFKKGIV